MGILQKSAIYVNNQKLVSDYPQFNGGERNVNIDLSLDKYGLNSGREEIDVVAYIYDSNTVMDLLLVCDSIRRQSSLPLFLIIPYIPYGRQDRVCNKGDAFGLKVFSELINSIKAERVYTLDPHSMVTDALINNVRSLNQEQIISLDLGFFTEKIREVNCIVSPDAGASKKSFEVASSFQTDDMIFVEASKRRNLKDGSITDYYLPDTENLNGKNILVCDDIADGGATFIYLAKAIKKKYKPNKMSLYVTHGLFSKGFEPFVGYYQEIYTLMPDNNGIPQIKEVFQNEN